MYLYIYIYRQTYWWCILADCCTDVFSVFRSSTLDALGGNPFLQVGKVSYAVCILVCSPPLLLVVTLGRGVDAKNLFRSIDFVAQSNMAKLIQDKFQCILSQGKWIRPNLSSELGLSRIKFLMYRFPCSYMNVHPCYVMFSAWRCGLSICVFLTNSRTYFWVSII